MTTGFKVNVNRSNFTIGLDYAFSFSDEEPSLADLSATSFASSAVRNTSISYNNVTFLFTYNFILDKLAGVIE